MADWLSDDALLAALASEPAPLHHLTGKELMETTAKERGDDQRGEELLAVSHPARPVLSSFIFRVCLYGWGKRPRTLPWPRDEATNPAGSCEMGKKGNVPPLPLSPSLSLFLHLHWDRVGRGDSDIFWRAFPSCGALAALLSGSSASLLE